jgi:xanthine dehydrogenase accessory factor
MQEIYQELVRLTSQGERAVIATIVASRGSAPRKAGAKMLIRANGTFIGSVGGGTIEEKVKEEAGEVLRTGESKMMHFDLSGTGEDAAMICGGQADVFLEPVLPAETLYLCGAGHIAQSTAVMGKMLGFRVVVIDPRPEYNNKEKLPDADLLIVEDFERAFTRLSIDENGYIIIYTPGHVSDETCLHFAVGTVAGYIGMIGSKKKVLEIKQRLTKKGVTPEQLDRVHAPIGIPIGAETPDEIAVSILAEVIQVRRSPRGH